MALEVTMTGTGSIGDIAPGWLVNKYATPVAIGDTGAGTGSVSFSARSTDDSLLVINNDVQSSINELGVVNGVVQSVSESGIATSITHGTYLDKFNLDVTVPPVESGGPRAWFYELGKAVFGEGIIGERPDYSIPIPASTSSTKQYSYCFPLDNTGLDLTNLHSIDSLFTNSTKTTDGSFGYSFSATEIPSFDSFNSPTPMLPGIQTAGNWYQPNPALPDLAGFEPYFDLMLDVDEFTDIQLWIKSGISDGSPSYFNLVRLQIDGVSNTVSVTNASDEATVVGDFTSMINGDPFLFTFYHETSSPIATPPATNRFHYKVTNSSGSSITGYVDCFLDGILNFAGDYINCTKMYYFNAGYVLSYTPIYNVPVEKSFGFNIDFTEYTENYTGPYPSCVGVAWELMQQIASAENFEIAVGGDTVYIRDVGARTFDISNVGPSPIINPASTLSGRQINIPYSEASFVNGVVYDARNDANNIISVQAGESTVTSVKHTVHPISVEQPQRYLATGTGINTYFTGPLPEGKYFVVDSTGLPIAENQWEDYGGSLNVEIDSDDPAAIKITLTGPYVEIPSTTGPYSLAASTGESEFAALSILGTGVYSGDSVLELLTGVDPLKYTRATVNTINNPFIVTQENAYDRGVWAAQKASGPVVTMSAAVPTSSLEPIPYTTGSLVGYRDNTYRITSVSMGAVSSTINAERYVTVNDIDSIWGVGEVSKTFTVNISVSATFTSANHGFANGTPLVFSTTGVLPSVRDSVSITSVSNPEVYILRYFCANDFYEGQTVVVSGYTGTYAGLWNGTRPVFAATPTYFDTYIGGDTPIPLPSGTGTALGYDKLEGGYVINSTTNTFKVSKTIGGTAIGTIGSQSGTHTATTSTYSVGDYDTLWENYECQDQIIFPYKVG